MGARRPTLFHYPTLGSTNDEALRLLTEEALPYFVTAAKQTAGRGRHGRKWHSPEGNLYCTAALPAQVPLVELPLFTLYAALALCHALAKKTKVKVWLKWPNDIWIGKKKLCGLLAESPVAKNGKRVLLLGIGLNVNTSEQPIEIASIATSLQQETGKVWKLEPLQKIITETILKTYQKFCEGKHLKHLYKLWSTYDKLTGKEIAYDEAGLTETGKVVGLAEDGSLCVKNADKVIRLRSGEVSLSRHLQ